VTLALKVGRYKNIPPWCDELGSLAIVSSTLNPDRHRDLVAALDSIPICLVGNKVDCRDRKVKPKHITYHRKKNLQYYDMSVKSKYNIEKPFLWITRKLLGAPNVEVEGEVGGPAELEINMALMREWEDELELARMAMIRLEDDDDDF